MLSRLVPPPLGSISLLGPLSEPFRNLQLVIGRSQFTHTPLSLLRIALGGTAPAAQRSKEP
jgi:hypothetical protein